MNLKAFDVHGVGLKEGNNGYHLTNSHAVGDCPFCGKVGKLYVNANTMAWDCKVCGEAGSLATFLDKICMQNKKALTKKRKEALAKDRGLPITAFNGLDLGWNGMEFTFPTRGPGGAVTDIRRYRIGGKIIKGTTGCATGLFGSENLTTKGDVYICEGEWDAIALRWLLKKLGKEGVVLGVPGANTFKANWAIRLTGRNVHVLYDNDDAGASGELVVRRRLTTAVTSMDYLHWPTHLQTGYDVRDYIIATAIKKSRPKATLRWLHSAFSDIPRNAIDSGVADNTPTTSTRTKKRTYPKIPIAELEIVTNKWLKLQNNDALHMLMAVTLSNRLDGRPLWMFFVGAPSTGKTEHVDMLADRDDAMMVSSLTPNALISGAPHIEDQDPSLIPKLDGKIMVIKDFTTIMSKRDLDKEEIFGILRDAFDGHCSKIFGTGAVKSYKSKFTIIAAVTHAIHELDFAALGPRFFKFEMGDAMVHHSEDEIIRKTMTNTRKETRMKKEMSDATNAFLNGITIDQDKLPIVPEDIIVKLISLAKFGARMRGAVSRDKFRGEMILSKPSAELGGRLGSQMFKLATCLAIVRDKDTVTDSEYKLCQKCITSTAPQRVEDVLEKLYRACPKHNDMLTITELSKITTYPISTIRRLIEDMTALGIVVKERILNRNEYTVSKYIRDLITKAELYT